MPARSWRERSLSCRRERSVEELVMTSARLALAAGGWARRRDWRLFRARRTQIQKVMPMRLPRPAWVELRWPFAIDQWGTGRAFACKATDCGAEVRLYIRAKLGSCNCATGVADDGDLDRMSDFDLIGGEVFGLSAPAGRSRLAG